MVLRAHLDPSPGVVDDRREARRTMQLATLGALPGGITANVTVHNLSASGLLLETELPLAQGEVIAVELPEAGPTDASVVWQSGQLFGCEFKTSISDSALAAAQTQDMLGRSGAGSDEAGSATRTASGFTEPFGVRLNRLRRERGLTLAQVADALEVSKPTVWAWEKGKARPLPERIDAIAAALGVSVEELGDTMPTSEGNAIAQECRLRIATAFGTDPHSIRIMIEI
ncbi:helix-turn-helix domain-containing protein [Erythrobacter rubeus]|uniref:Helix-turn-helix domain-containing protein n=1 Tax=Erythrobacter rubeus TaxID=2760803 RepID=A0ABR8KZ44_9SPHN|nr:helix-turn-helix domain-containing protein [Erythrobacter rubeus]MBD2843492.1 helix-turn-helix domain-containing protein [Erythrobacter rubeus]